LKLRFDLFKTEKPNVYLGSLAVVSAGKLANLENIFSLQGNSLHAHMRDKLEEIFCLHNVSSIKEIKSSDVGLDIVIVTLRGGDAFTVDWGNGGLPLFWRPKITLVSRLYNLHTQKTLKIFNVSQSVTWKAFFIKQFSFRGLFRWGSLYDKEDMEILLFIACLILIDKMRKAI
jgi:hypothetical protein